MAGNGLKMHALSRLYFYFCYCLLFKIENFLNFSLAFYFPILIYASSLWIISYPKSFSQKQAELGIFDLQYELIPLI